MTVQTEQLIKEMKMEKTIKIVIENGIVVKAINVPEGYKVEIEDDTKIYEEEN
tara:strand:+ start:698 stop:856 length:159 start_codon:yes stop_codon:yes gene_type:complete